MTTATEDGTTNAAEPITPEVVEPSAAIERVEPPPMTPTETAIERAAQLAIDSPGVPGRDEFLALAAQARILSLSGAAPKLVRNNPHLAFHVALIGRDLGLSPSAALQLIDVIGEGDKTQLSLSPQLLIGQIRRLGLGVIRRTLLDNERCVATAYDPDGIEIGSTEYSWQEAQLAGLVDVRCSDAMTHWSSGQSKCSCRTGWKTYPKRMLWWRACGYAADDYFPEASLGMYSAEELGALIDDDGRALDPATAELPEGYEPAALPEASGDQRAEAAGLFDVQLRIAALPADERADLGAKWKQLAALAGPNGTVVKPSHLTVSQVKLVSSLLAGLETKAKRSGWNASDAKIGVLTALSAALSAVFGVSATDGPPDEPGAGDNDTPPDPARSLSDAAVTDAVPADDRERVAERVNEMSIEDVDAALVEYERETTGTETKRRQRLVLVLLRELLSD